MKVGVFIPTIPVHWKHVPGIVAEYLKGYVKPDRIAVLLSRSNDVPVGDRMRFKTSCDPSVQLYESPAPLNTGAARQQALHLLKDCDVISYQDSDDLPHWDRIKVIREIFESNPDALVLHHSYHYAKSWQGPIYKDRITEYKTHTGDWLYEQYFPNGKIEECISHFAFGDVMGFPVHAGVSSIKREVLEEVPWKIPSKMKIAPEPKAKTEDYEFSMECLFKYKGRHLITDARIYLYR